MSVKRSTARRCTAAAALLCGLSAAWACGGGRGDARPAAPSAGSGAAGDTGAFRPLAVGDAAPAYTTATLAGGKVDVGAAGGPVTLLNVWATWCTSCREEMGDLAALDREFRPGGLRVLAVSVDQGPAARVARFVEHERLPFVVGHDPEGQVQERFRVVGVPETYLIGRDGRIRWTHAGNVHDVLPQARAAIEAALR